MHLRGVRHSIRWGPSKLKKNDFGGPGLRVTVIICNSQVLRPRRREDMRGKIIFIGFCSGGS